MFKQQTVIAREEWATLAPTEVRDLCLRKIPHGAYFVGAYLMKESANLRVMYLPYQAGDIVGVLGGAGAEVTSRIFEPKTRLYHFLIIGDYLTDEDDYEIYEAIASGVRTGRLSWYAEDLYVVFRLNDPDSEKLGKRAAQEASAFGRWGYDYVMYLYIALDLARIYGRMIFKERRVRRVRPGELTYRENHAFICTEFANVCYRSGGRPPIPKGETPLPAGYIEAYKDGKLLRVGANTPAKYRYIFYSRDILPNLTEPLWAIVCNPKKEAGDAHN